MQPTIRRRHRSYGGNNGELQNLKSQTDSKTKQEHNYRMEVGTKKSKIPTNSTNPNSEDISMNGQKLEEVSSFKCLGVTLCNDGICSVEILISIASAMAEMARLNRIRLCNVTSCVSKFNLLAHVVRGARSKKPPWPLAKIVVEPAVTPDQSRQSSLTRLGLKIRCKINWAF